MLSDSVQRGQVIARPLPGRAVVLLESDRRVSADVPDELAGALTVGCRARVTLGPDGRAVAIRPALHQRRHRP